MALRAILAAAAAITPVVTLELRARGAQDDVVAEWIRRHAAVQAGRGRLFRVRDVDLLQLGVRPPQAELPFSERDEQIALDGKLGPGQAVL